VLVSQTIFCLRKYSNEKGLVTHLILLEKEFNTLGKTVNSLKLSLEHVIEVELDITDYAKEEYVSTTSNLR
jgi:hypothetical protein